MISVNELLSVLKQHYLGLSKFRRAHIADRCCFLIGEINHGFSMESMAALGGCGFANIPTMNLPCWKNNKDSTYDRYCRASSRFRKPVGKAIDSTLEIIKVLIDEC